MPFARHLLSWIRLALALAAPNVNVNPAPPVEWPAAIGGNGHQYQAVEAPAGISWTDAQAWAMAHGGYLATIHSPAENSFVYGLIDEPKYWINNATGDRTLGPWLGGFKSGSSTSAADGWQWVNGEGAFRYTNWMPTEPDGDDFLQFLAPTGGSRQATWNDVENTRPVHGFVVEFDTDAEIAVKSTYVSAAAAAASGPPWSAGGSAAAASFGTAVPPVSIASLAPTAPAGPGSTAGQNPGAPSRRTSLAVPQSSSLGMMGGRSMASSVWPLLFVCLFAFLILLAGLTIFLLPSKPVPDDNSEGTS